MEIGNWKLKYNENINGNGNIKRNGNENESRIIDNLNKNEL